MSAPPSHRLEAHLLTHLDADVRRRLAPAGTSPEIGHGGVHGDVRLRLRRAIRDAVADGPHVALHAAACRTANGIGLLLPGPSRAGKSTLALALACERGASIVTDDTVTVDDDRAVGVGAPVSVRTDSPYWKAARHLWYAEDVDRLLVLPQDLGAPPPARDVVVDIIVFPSFGGGHGLEALTPAAALCRLVSAIIGRAPADRLLALGEFVASRPAFLARYASVAEAVDLVDDAARAHAEWPSSPLPVTLSSHETSGFTADVMGIRFGDEVAMFNPASGDIVHFAHWPAGWAPEVPSWGALIGGAGVRR